MSTRLEYFDTRRVWSRYSGQSWGDSAAEKARAIHDAREFYNATPHLWPGGVRLVTVSGRIVWSIAAEPTFRLEARARGGEWCEIWGEIGLSRRDAEHGRDHQREFLGRAVRIVQEDYPRELAPVEPVKPPAFSTPDVQPAARPAGRPVAPVTFQFGEDNAACTFSSSRSS